jgi:hypothetical protein
MSVPVRPNSQGIIIKNLPALSPAARVPFELQFRYDVLLYVTSLAHGAPRLPLQRCAFSMGNPMVRASRSREYHTRRTRPWNRGWYSY